MFFTFPFLLIILDLLLKYASQGRQVKSTVWYAFSITMSTIKILKGSWLIFTLQSQFKVRNRTARAQSDRTLIWK